MKEVLKYLATFCVLAFIFSNLASCGGSSVANVIEPGGSATPATEGKKSEFPPLASKLAKAELQLIDGTVTTVEEHKGKIVLLNLWGIWCAPCRVEMPHLIALQTEHKANGFEIIGLNVGNEDMEPEDIERIKAFAEEMGLNYDLARIDLSVSEDFARETKFAGVPLSVLVDRDGNLRGVFGGAGPSSIRKLQETIAKVVAEG